MAETNEDKPHFPRLLICEGPEDCFFFHRLIETRNLPRFHIWHTGGRKHSRGGNAKFGEAIAGFQISRPKTFASLRDIVIVADNDEAPKDNFDNVCRQIDEFFGAGSAPSKPLERTTKIKPAVSVLMIPWASLNGHLERLCVPSARDADKTIGKDVDTFMALIGAEKWNNDSRFGKAWLRTNLAVRCVVDPFVALGKVFDEDKHHQLIPVNHSSFKDIADFLITFNVQGTKA